MVLEESLQYSLSSPLILIPMNSLRRSNLTWRTLSVLLTGQLLSLSLALSSFTSSLLARLGVNAPITQSVFIYFFLALVYGGILLYRRQRIHMSWYWYFLLAFADVQGNYFINKAYQLTSITSVQLLDCFAIAWAIGLTWIFLHTRYSIWQLCGAVICILGLGLVLLSDARSHGGGGSKPLLGDLFVIIGTIFYAISNVGQEFCVKKTGRVEVVAMMGFFGMLISLVELSIFELKHLESLKWTPKIISAFSGHAFTGFMFYTLSPFVLQMSGAAMFNLSLLTADMWAVIIRIFVYHQHVNPLYYVSFLVVVIGIVIYSANEKDQVQETGLEDQLNIQEENPPQVTSPKKEGDTPQKD